jgi:hypothetical protein
MANRLTKNTVAEVAAKRPSKDDGRSAGAVHPSRRARGARLRMMEKKLK